MVSERNPEAIGRIKIKHIRELESRRGYLLAREADADTPFYSLVGIRKERKALDVAIVELWTLYTSRREIPDEETGEMKKADKNII